MIESTYRHDFKFCSCHRCAVDGGLDYLRRCGNPGDYEDLSEYKEIEITPKYKVGDTVEFSGFPLTESKIGIIQVVDTFPDSTVIYYDIFDEKEPRLYKYINEKNVGKYVEIMSQK